MRNALVRPTPVRAVRADQGRHSMCARVREDTLFQKKKHTDPPDRPDLA